MGAKNQKTTTYSLDWEVVINLESRLLRDFQSQKSLTKAELLHFITWITLTKMFWMMQMMRYYDDYHLFT